MEIIRKIKNIFKINNRYPNKNEIINLIKKSEYFNNITYIDFFARIHREPKYDDKYIDYYCHNIEELDNNQKKILDNLLLIIENSKIRKYNKFFDNHWIFAINDIENEWPHTICEVIILPRNFFKWPEHEQIKILLHEKTHIFQRFHKKLHDDLIEMLSFVKYCKRDSLLLSPYILSNPDIDNYIYMNTKTSTIQFLIFDNSKPKSIQETKLIKFDPIHKVNKHIKWNVPEYIHQTDHPYEIIACALSSILYNKMFLYSQNPNIKITTFDYLITSWIEDNMK